jgi:hypothetical protein
MCDISVVDLLELVCHVLTTGFPHRSFGDISEA